MARVNHVSRLGTKFLEASFLDSNLFLHELQTEHVLAALYTCIIYIKNVNKSSLFSISEQNYAMLQRCPV